MNKRTLAATCIVFAALAAIVGSIGYCWVIRDTDESLRAERKAAMKEMRALPADDWAPFLRRIITETSFRAQFGGSFPWLRVGFRTRVSFDYAAMMCEEAFLHFAGNGTNGSEDAVHLKQVLAVSSEIMPLCESDSARNSLRDRQLDGHFLAKDYDGAAALLEAGLPGHTMEWCKGSAAKVRAHQAMENGKRKEAIGYLLQFGEFMLSKAMDDFEDCDPTSGILYSREWVVGRNFMRISKLSKEIGDAARAAEYADKAKAYLKDARGKAKDDKRSAEALEAEIKSYGLGL